MMDGGEYQDCKSCRAQALHCEELEERIRQLEHELFNREWEPPSEFRLTGMQVKILQAMRVSDDRTFSKEFLVDASRTPRCNGLYPNPKLIDTVMFNIRQKLKPFGLEIQTVWGRGYRLSPASRDRLTNWTSPHEKAA